MDISTLGKWRECLHPTKKILLFLWQPLMDTSALGIRGMVMVPQVKPKHLIHDGYAIRTHYWYTMVGQKILHNNFTSFFAPIFVANVTKLVHINFRKNRLYLETGAKEILPLYLEVIHCGSGVKGGFYLGNITQTFVRYKLFPPTTPRWKCPYAGYVWHK